MATHEQIETLIIAIQMGQIDTKQTIEELREIRKQVRNMEFEIIKLQPKK